MNDLILDMIDNLKYLRENYPADYVKTRILDDVIGYLSKEKEPIDEQTMEHTLSYFLGSDDDS